MTIWALADLHLAFGNPEKSMEAFGPEWRHYPEKIEKSWKKLVKKQDLVLIPGDISWAMKLDAALKDLDWIDRLPGQKLLIRGNHDYWWSSAKKIRQVLPPTLHIIQNDAFLWNGVAFGGVRLWDTHEYSFNELIDFVENPLVRKKSPEELAKEVEAREKIFDRELKRLELSLQQLDAKAVLRIALTHYPPIGKDLLPSRASTILENFKIDVCVFGHLHRVRANALPFGTARGVRYVFASADYLGFTPIKIFD